MPSKNKAGKCGCCTCCVPTTPMRASVSFGSLPGIAVMDTGSFVGCVATSSGYADTTVPMPPPWAANVIVTDGASHVQLYSSLSRLLNTATFQCYRFNTVTDIGGVPGSQIDPKSDLVSQIAPIDGSIELIKKLDIDPETEEETEPEGPPYFVEVDYYVYTNGAGHCILRVGARPYKNDRLDPVPYDSGLLGGNYSHWNLTTSSYQYSTHHPCAMDYGELPPTADTETVPTEDAGVWLSGTRYDYGSIADKDWQFRTKTRESGDLWTASELNDAMDAYTLPLFGWAWEIDLTASGISDLASLPSTSLDWTTVTGVLTGSVFDPIIPIASMPGTYFDGVMSLYSPGSTVLGPNCSLTDDSTIVNDGVGGHICKVGDRDGLDQCAIVYGTPYVIHRTLEIDFIQWLYRVDIDMSTYDVAWKGFSLTIGPKP